MNKKLYATVSERANGACEICGEYGGEYLQLHHIINGSGKRRQHETEYSCIMLCVECHNEVHSNFRLNISLKKMVQALYMGQRYNEQEVRRMMGGKLY